MASRIRTLLERPHADRWIILLATLLVCASLDTGLAADDYLHQLILSGSHAIEGFVRARLDLFHFASPAHNRALLDEGVFPWWADPNIRFAFWRPVAALTHFVDYLLWRESALLMHAHSIVWHGAALTAAAFAYRRVVRPRWFASLALLLYALDDARGAPVAWIANRNALISCAFSFAALAFHIDARVSGVRRYRFFAAVAFALGLLAGEGGIAVAAYLFAFALFLDEGKLDRRLLDLWPYAATVIVWGVVTRAMGYGVHGSAVYLDPIGEPLAFLEHAPARLLVLLFAQIGGPWSEGYNAYEFFYPGLTNIVLALGLVGLGLTAALFTPLWRCDARARFFLAGTVLSAIPSCAAFPADRLLPWIGFGAMGATALLLGEIWRGAYPLGTKEWQKRLTPVVGVGIALVHLVASPLMLPMRSRGIAQVRTTIDRANDTIPKDAAITEQTAIYVNPPADPFASFIPIRRAATNTPRPKIQRWLCTGLTDVHVTREGPRSLRVRPAAGFVSAPSEQLLRGPGYPLPKGRKIELPGLLVQITETTPDGRPQEILATFDKPLEDASYRWLVWRGSGYLPFAPPATGEAVDIPPVDLLEVAYGSNSPVTQWIRSASGPIATTR